MKLGLAIDRYWRWAFKKPARSEDLSETPVNQCPSKGGTERLKPVVDSVWDFVAKSIKESPVQPVANLGLGLGQENPPQFLIDAHKDALDVVDCNQYGPTNGLPAFRETLSRVYTPLYGRTLSPTHEISVHSGGTEAILSIITAFVEPGDEVVVLEPAFDLYELHTKFVGGVLRSVPLHPPNSARLENSKADEWSLNIAELEEAFTPKTRILVLNTPHNPLGKVFNAEELLAIGDVCVKHGVIILSDEVYERLYYMTTFPRIASLRSDIARHTVTVGSIGKAFNATGWRLGYVIGDKDLIKHVQNAHIILSYTTAGPPQLAAAKGLEVAEGKGFWEDNRREMKRKIEILCGTFRELNLPYVEPSGAHYIFLNAGRMQIPDNYSFPASIELKTRDWKLCFFLIQEFGVASIPASASFSNANAHVAQDYLRFVACKTEPELSLAKERLRGLEKYL